MYDRKLANDVEVRSNWARKRRRGFSEDEEEEEENSKCHTKLGQAWRRKGFGVLSLDPLLVFHHTNTDCGGSNRIRGAGRRSAAEERGAARAFSILRSFRGSRLDLANSQLKAP